MAAPAARLNPPPEGVLAVECGLAEVPALARQEFEATRDESVLTFQSAVIGKARELAQQLHDMLAGRRYWPLTIAPEIQQTVEAFFLTLPRLVVAATSRVRARPKRGGPVFARAEEGAPVPVEILVPWGKRHVQERFDENVRTFIRRLPADLAEPLEDPVRGGSLLLEQSRRALKFFAEALRDNASAIVYGTPGTDWKGIFAYHPEIADALVLAGVTDENVLEDMVVRLVEDFPRWVP